MDYDPEQAIMEMLQRPGWTTTRGVMRKPSGDLDPEELRTVEDVMRRLAREGKVGLWKLIIQDSDEELLAAAKPELELDAELEQRQAWARAVRVPVDD